MVRFAGSDDSFCEGIEHTSDDSFCERIKHATGFMVYCKGANMRDNAAVNREHKDRLFISLFGSAERKENTLELYNAVNGTHYNNPDDITIYTIEDALYLGMKNDVAFLIACDMNLFEHQSTMNPNMRQGHPCRVSAGKKSGGT